MAAKKRRTFLFVLGLLAILCVAGPLLHPDVRRWFRELTVTPDELLLNTPWTWDASKTRQFYATQSSPLGIRFKGKNLEFVLGETTIVSTTTDANAPFLLTRGARRLVVAHYDRRPGGCTVKAYHPKTGKLLWSTELKALDSSRRGKNRVQFVQDHGRYLTVLGEERSGNYVEILDLEDGKTVAHRAEIAPVNEVIFL